MNGWYGAVYLYAIAADGWTSGGSVPVFVTKIDRKYAGISLNIRDKFGSSIAFNADSTKLVVGVPGTSSDTGNVRLIHLLFDEQDSANTIERQLNAGTDVQLVASNDITVNADITATSGSGTLTLIAGRSIIVNQDIDIKGSLVLKANGTGIGGLGMKPLDRQKGKAAITVAVGKKIETGKNVMIKMLKQERWWAIHTKRSATGKITVGKVKGERVSIIHDGETNNGNDNSESEIVIRSGGQIQATKSLSPSSKDPEVDLEIKAEKFTNQSDGNALKTNRGSRYLVWTKTPSNNTMGGITNYNFVMFDESYADAGSGDFRENPVSGHHQHSIVQTDHLSGFVYSINPSAILKMTAKEKTKMYDGTSDMVAVFDGNLKLKDPNAVPGLTFAFGNVQSGGNNYEKFFLIHATLDGEGKFYKNGVPNKDAGTNLILRYKTPTQQRYKDGNNKDVYGITISYEDVTDASITPRPLKVGATYSNRDYDGTTDVTHQATAIISGWAANEGSGKDTSDVFNGGLTATAAGKNAGTHAVTLGGLTSFKTAYATNYTFDFTNDTSYDNSHSITIDKKALKVGATYQSRDYDGTTKVTINQAIVTIDGWVGSEGNSNVNRVFNGTLTATAVSKNAGTHIVTLGGLTGIKSPYATNYKLRYDNSKSVTIRPRPLNLEIDDTSEFYVRDRAYQAGKVSVPVFVEGGKKGFDSRDLMPGDSGVILVVREGGFVYSDDKEETNKPVFVGDIHKFVLSSPNYRLQYKSRDLVSGTRTARTGNIVKATKSSGGRHRRSVDTPSSGVSSEAFAAMGSGMLALMAAGVTGGTGAGAIILGMPLVSTDTIFNSGVYAQLNGIDMQALYQPPTQTPVSSVFDTQRTTYKVTYTTSYDMALLANNIKAQKVVPLYELDEKMYETLKRIFVQQPLPTDKTAGIRTQKPLSS